MKILNEIDKIQSQIYKNENISYDLKHITSFNIEQQQDKLYAFMQKVAILQQTDFRFMSPDNIEIEIETYKIYNYTNKFKMFSMKLIPKGWYWNFIEINVNRDEQLISEKNGNKNVCKGVSYFKLSFRGYVSECLMQRYKNAFLWFLENYDELLDEIMKKERLECLNKFIKSSYYEHINDSFRIDALINMMKTYYNTPENLCIIIPKTTEIIDLGTKTLKELKELANSFVAYDMYKDSIEKLNNEITNLIPELEQKRDDILSHIYNITDCKLGNYCVYEKTMNYYEEDKEFHYLINMCPLREELKIKLLNNQNKNIWSGHIIFDKNNAKYDIYELYHSNLNKMDINSIIEFVDSLKYLCNNWSKIIDDFFDDVIKDLKLELKQLENKLQKSEQIITNLETDIKIKYEYYENLFSSCIGEKEYILF